MDVPDSDDESTDFSDFIIVKDDPYFPDDSFKVEQTTGASHKAPVVVPTFSKAKVVVIDEPTPTKVELEPPSPAGVKLEVETKPVISASGAQIQERIKKLQLLGAKLRTISVLYFGDCRKLLCDKN